MLLEAGQAHQREELARFALISRALAPQPGAVRLHDFLSDAVIPYERDEVTRLTVDTHDQPAFALVRSMTVGDFRDWLLREETDEQTLARLAPGLTPEIVAGVSKIMIEVLRKRKVGPVIGDADQLNAVSPIRRCSLAQLGFE